MLKSKTLRNIVASGLLILLTAVVVCTEATDVLSGRDLLRVVREKKGNFPKPAYSQRLALAEEPEPAELVVANANAKPTEAPAEEKPVGDELLKMVPAESLFCVRLNNFDYTVGQIDQFLAGVSPIPMGLSMLARMQLASVLGSPALNGVNTAGDFGLFGVAAGPESTEAGPVPNMFIGGIIPVSDFQQFVSGNSNVGQPDAKGVSKITSQGMPELLATQVGNYVLISSSDNYDKLAGHKKLMGIATSASAQAAPLAIVLDSAEVESAMKEPLWAYGNIQLASKIFGPMLFAQIEGFKTMMQAMGTDENAALGPSAKMSDMYVGILETFMKETNYVSIAINPKPTVLYITKTISAVPGTQMADMFAAGASAGQENKLLGYLEDGAMMNFAFKINTPSFRNLAVKSVDLLATLAGDNITAEDITKMKSLATDAIDALGESGACSVLIDSASKPPIVLKFGLDVKDAKSFERVIEEATEMMNASLKENLTKDTSKQDGYTIQLTDDNYKGVSIGSFKLVMESTDSNSPQGQMKDVMFGGGFDYRWAVVNELYVCAIGGDVDSAIHRLIDNAKAGGPKQIASEMQTALELIPEGKTADFIGTYNYLRALKMAGAMMPMMPLPQIDVPTKSNLVFAGKVGDGKVKIDAALPKEHLKEIVGAFMMMQQQMMPQMQQGQGAWTCQMHPQIVLPQKGNCPMCGMELVAADKPKQ